MTKLYDNTKVGVSFVPAVRTADADGTGVDTLGYRDGMVVIQAGDIDLANADETYAFHVEESDDNSTFTDVDGATGTVTADNDTVLIRVPELNVARKRYLRVVLDVGGTSPSIPCSAHVLMSEGYAGPANA